ncbi:chitin binding domain protein [Lysobacter antibioticus]|uniref:lytic polysaccharide monooxygenase n=1 Tax=Lysobacter antibioticus TaxID=84531 RepID=UPI000716F0F0|nr:lytic polysaccharide monooxygenase [Lysobacter antibioticus]ALN64943.1 chitin binding domain protein [Lysobacter antibioticus]
MNRIARTSLLVSGAALCAALLPVSAVQAHGTFVNPQSRIYKCYLGNKENPADPACRAAWAVAGPQLFYDWNGINQANANSNHQAVVPNGKLCSGGNPTFRGLDVLRSDWQATTLRSGSSHTFTFYATAPHATKEWTFYVTPQGWNPSTALQWSSMQQFCKSAKVPLSSGNNYHITCTLPNRTGRHVIYNTWQRSDSTEAFYTCMDVNFSNALAERNSAWRDAGNLNVANDYPVGTTVTLRVFNADGSDAEKVETVLRAGETSVIDWPRRIGDEVNARSRFARIGEKRGAEPIQAKSGSAGNHVWLTGNRSYAFDVRLPESAQPYADEHAHHGH